MDTTHFIRFFLRILRILLHLKFPSNPQDFTTPQTAFLQNHSTQTIGKLALFEKSCHSRKEEARTGWSNVDHKKIGRKSYSLNQSVSEQLNAISWGLWGRRKVTLIPPPLKRLPQASLGLSFRGLKTLRGGIHDESTPWAQRKEHRKTEFEKKNSEKKFGESETFYRSKFSPATSVMCHGFIFWFGHTKIDPWTFPIFVHSEKVCSWVFHFIEWMNRMSEDCFYYYS